MNVIVSKNNFPLFCRLELEELNASFLSPVSSRSESKTDKQTFRFSSPNQKYQAQNFTTIKKVLSFKEFQDWHASEHLKRIIKYSTSLYTYKNEFSYNVSFVNYGSLPKK